MGSSIDGYQQHIGVDDSVPKPGVIAKLNSAGHSLRSCICDFLHAVWVWEHQVSFELRVSPRYLTWLDQGIFVGPMLSGLCHLLQCGNTTAMLLEAFTTIFQFSAQSV